VRSELRSMGPLECRRALAPEESVVVIFRSVSRIPQSRYRCAADKIHLTGDGEVRENYGRVVRV
jgi:hypothetical protein